MMLLTVILILLSIDIIDGFVVRPTCKPIEIRSSRPLYQSSTTSQPTTTTPPTNKAAPREGLAQTLLNLALDSWLWKLVLVPQARENIVKTAEANDIQWRNALKWIQSQNGPWKEENKVFDSDSSHDVGYSYPEYYTKEFHAYADVSKSKSISSWTCTYLISQFLD